jgi:hypothetical protein
MMMVFNAIATLAPGGPMDPLECDQIEEKQNAKYIAAQVQDHISTLAGRTPG